MSEETSEKGRAPQADNALKHGTIRYLATGELPADLQGLDKEIAGEVLKQVGNDEKFRLISVATARAFVVNELLYRHFVAEHSAHPGQLPTSLKMYGSYQESLRRFLAELGLTPASIGRIKQDDGQVSAQTVLDAVKANNEQSE